MARDLGPLPKGDRQDTLQQLSIKAFRNLLPEDQFLFRDERTDDKGVDGALEVKVDGEFTNCRTQVQLKSSDADPTKPGVFNKDGSYSESIATANLNYLLYGTSPLYVIWLAKLNELRFAWASDEWRKLDVNNPDWRTQGSFTIRFSQILTLEALFRIRDRILDEAQMHRRIHESITRSAPAERVVVSIDPKTLTSTDPKELHEWLSTSGMTIVSSGYGKQVLEWHALLNPSAAVEPRIQLVAAFAAASVGKYHQAKGYLAGVVTGLAELPADDRMFWEYLGDGCDYHTGRIDRAEYLKREAEWARRLSGVKAKEHQLHVLRQQRISEQKADRRAEMLNEIRILVADIETHPEARPPQKIQAKLILVSAEGDDLGASFIEDAAQIGMRADMGFSGSLMASEKAKSAGERWTEWEKRIGRLRDDAVGVRHPLLIADVLTARITRYVVYLMLRRAMTLGLGNDQKPAQVIVDILVRDAGQAVDVYRAAGNLAGEFQVKLLLADLYTVNGNETRSREIAREVLPVARAMNYEQLVALAVAHLEGKSVWHRFAAILTNPPTSDQIALSQTDEQVRDMARMTVTSLQIPTTRLPLVEKDLFAGRRMAQERRDWCRHLDLHQDQRHTQQAETAYDIDPERVCVCTKLHYQSSIPLRDYETVIDSFKSSRCKQCTIREPGNGAI